jgi:hypothetical protein
MQEKVSDSEAIKFYEWLVPDNPESENTIRTQKVRSQMRMNFHEGRGADIAGRNAWGLYNSVTEFTSHQLRFHGETNTDSREQRFNSVLLGRGYDLQRKAFREIVGNFVGAN